MHALTVIAAVTLGLLSPAAPALAQGDPAAGEALAARLCAECHAIGREGPSPVPEAPPFASFAAKWPLEHLAEAFAEGIVVGHGEGVRMPEFRFEPPDIDNLLAYLGMLRGE